jgi:CRP-like cAMP-binding protein
MKLDIQERIRFLRSLSFFASLSERDLSDIAIWSSRISYKKGDVIVREGSPGRGLYILLSGKADVLVKSGPEERIVGTLSPQDLFGEMSLIEETPRTSSVIVAGEAECLYLDAHILREKMTSHPDVMINLLKTLCRRLRDTVRKLRGF